MQSWDWSGGAMEKKRASRGSRRPWSVRGEDEDYPPLLTWGEDLCSTGFVLSRINCVRYSYVNVFRFLLCYVSKRRK